MGDLARVGPNTEMGELVWLRDNKLSSSLKGRTSKMELLYKGPYLIARILGEHTYELANMRSKGSIGRYHKQLLKPFIRKSNMSHENDR